MDKNIVSANLRDLDILDILDFPTTTILAYAANIFVYLVCMISI